MASRDIIMDVVELNNESDKAVPPENNTFTICFDDLASSRILPLKSMFSIEIPIMDRGELIQDGGLFIRNVNLLSRDFDICDKPWLSKKLAASL